ncbi:MAG: SH3 domain-containing protein [Lachnospiraceae bacterium]|nr:SH3 domain-containing protein [Lachnospiraceae bacterium]
MKGGSNKIFLMAVAYVVITVVMFLIFQPMDGEGTVKSAGYAEKDERIIGEVGYSQTFADLSDETQTSEAADTAAETTAQELTDASVDASAEETAQESTDASVETSGETSAEATTEAEPENPDIHYYSFKVINVSTFLMVRDADSLSAKVIARLREGEGGYVLEQGEEWSKVVTEDGRNIGYCFNRYLDLTEITREEFLQDYVDQVTE